jgi:chromatin remodeling complex protein RSC6
VYIMARKVKSDSSKQMEKPVEETTVVEEEVPTLDADFDALLGEMNAMRKQLTVLTSTLRALRARSSREMKAAQKAAGKKRKSNVPRKPSGFVKPAPISPELAKFLKKSSDELVARTEVTKEITAYIRKHNLQDKDNGRYIHADDKLRKLLKVKKGDELTYFNLQRYLAPHFPKAA